MAAFLLAKRLCAFKHEGFDLNLFFQGLDISQVPCLLEAQKKYSVKPPNSTGAKLNSESWWSLFSQVPPDVYKAKVTDIFIRLGYLDGKTFLFKRRICLRLRRMVCFVGLKPLLRSSDVGFKQLLRRCQELVSQEVSTGAVYRGNHVKSLLRRYLRTVSLLEKGSTYQPIDFSCLS